MTLAAPTSLDFSSWKASLEMRHDLATSAPGGLTPEQWALHLRGAQTVAGQMSELVKDTEWGTFAAHLTELRREDLEQAEAAEHGLAASNAVGDELTRLKLQARYLRGRVDAWDVVLGLPQLLIAQNAAIQPPSGVAATRPGE